MVLPEGRDLIDLGLEPCRGGGARGGAKGRVSRNKYTCCMYVHSSSSTRSCMLNGIGVNQEG